MKMNILTKKGFKIFLFNNNYRCQEGDDVSYKYDKYIWCRD